MKTIRLTKKEHELLNYFLDRLEDELDNSGCNDIFDDIIGIFTEKEGEDLANQVNKLYKSSEKRNAKWPSLFDTELLDLLRKKIKRH